MYAMVDEHYWRQFEVFAIRLHRWLHIMVTQMASEMHIQRAIYIVVTNHFKIQSLMFLCYNASFRFAFHKNIAHEPVLLLKHFRLYRKLS